MLLFGTWASGTLLAGTIGWSLVAKVASQVGPAPRVVTISAEDTEVAATVSSARSPSTSVDLPLEWSAAVGVAAETDPAGTRPDSRKTPPTSVLVQATTTAVPPEFATLSVKQAPATMTTVGPVTPATGAASGKAVSSQERRSPATVATLATSTIAQPNTTVAAKARQVATTTTTRFDAPARPSSAPIPPTALGATSVPPPSSAAAPVAPVVPSTTTTVLVEVTTTSAPPTTTSPGVTSTTASSPTSTAPPQSAAFSTKLGNVGVHCNANVIVLDFATPVSGASVRVANAGPEEIEVHFRKDAQESEIHLVCRSGAPRSSGVSEDG